MINIAELLKDAPEGMKLYSPLVGEVEFAEVMDTDYLPIRVMKRGYGFRFDEYGRYKGDEYPDSECLLFPSKDCRTWKGWELTVKPKFKVGNWVVIDNCHNSTYQIECVREYDYMLKHTHGGLMPFPFSSAERLRLWSIADAKDGDVLATNSIICIFKKLDKDGYYISSPCIYTVKDGLEVIDDENDSIGSCGLKPATKEDRELLFRKMKEAGYEWDADKKELRKIKSHYDIANFKSFDKVLVRDRNDESWRIAFYGYYNKEARYSHFVGTCWSKQCIPFEGNEHLLGTTDMCDKQYINW